MAVKQDAASFISDDIIHKGQGSCESIFCQERFSPSRAGHANDGLSGRDDPVREEHGQEPEAMWASEDLDPGAMFRGKRQVHGTVFSRRTEVT